MSVREKEEIDENMREVYGEGRTDKDKEMRSGYIERMRKTEKGRGRDRE